MYHDKEGGEGNEKIEQRLSDNIKGEEVELDAEDKARIIAIARLAVDIVEPWKLDKETRISLEVSTAAA